MLFVLVFVSLFFQKQTRASAVPSLLPAVSSSTWLTNFMLITTLQALLGIYRLLNIFVLSFAPSWFVLFLLEMDLIHSEDRKQPQHAGDTLLCHSGMLTVDFQFFYDLFIYCRWHSLQWTQSKENTLLPQKSFSGFPTKETIHCY